MSRRSPVSPDRPPRCRQPTYGLWPTRRVKSWKPLIRAANGRRWPPWCSFRGGCVTSDCVRLRLRFHVGAYGTCGCRVRAAPCVERVVPRQQRRRRHRRCHPRPGRGRGNTRGRDVSIRGDGRADSRARSSSDPDEPELASLASQPASQRGGGWR